MYSTSYDRHNCSYVRVPLTFSNHGAIDTPTESGYQYVRLVQVIRMKDDNANADTDFFGIWERVPRSEGVG